MLKTECIQSSFGFEACGRHEIVARFDGGTITSDGGALLLRQTEKRLKLLPRLAACFLDGRQPERIEHSVEEMLAQRIYGLALGYEDVNDHEQLRIDPLFHVLAERDQMDRSLAGKSTLNRLELGAGVPDRYKKITYWTEGIDELLTQLFLETHQQAPAEVILDIDTTDLPLHGNRRGDSFMATTTNTAISRCMCSAASRYCAPDCASRITMPRLGVWRRSSES